MRAYRPALAVSMYVLPGSAEKTYLKERERYPNTKVELTRVGSGTGTWPWDHVSKARRGEQHDALRWFRAQVGEPLVLRCDQARGGG